MAPITRRRKFNLRNSSSEEFDQDSGRCSIELFAASKDDFRVAPGSKIPIAWPFMSLAASKEASEILGAMQTQIEHCLKAYMIEIQDVHVRGLCENDSSTRHDTIIIISQDHKPILWKMAVTDVQARVDNMINLKGSQAKIRVEIRDPSKMYRDISTTIRPNTKAHRACKDVENGIYEKVKELCPGQWRIVSFNMRGPGEKTEDRQPTVMVRIEPRAHNVWQVIENELVRVLDALNSQDIPLHIELLPGFAFPAISEDILPPSGQLIHDLPDVPISGSSIGPRGGREAGSLGMWVDFQPPGDAPKQRCFLTCYHVIASGDATNREFNNQYGIGLDGRAVQKSITVDYPAPLDASYTEKELQQEIDNGQDPTAEKAQIIQKIKRNIDAGGVGIVVHASGILRRNQAGRRLDWALVRTKQSNPEQVNKPPPAGFSADALWNKFIYKVGAGETVSTWAAPEYGAWVAKQGRSLGATAGEINSLDARIRWFDGSESREIQLAAHDSRAFCKPGDSGTMVVNIQKQFIGMLIGREVTPELSYMTSIQELMDDIRARTGGSISLPGGTGA